MVEIKLVDGDSHAEPIAIRRLVEECGGSQAAAARELGLSSTVISRALREGKVKAAFELAARFLVQKSIDAEREKALLICVVPAEKRALLETFLAGAGIVAHDVRDLLAAKGER